MKFLRSRPIEVRILISEFLAQSIAIASHIKLFRYFRFITVGKFGLVIGNNYVITRNAGLFSILSSIVDDIRNLKLNNFRIRTTLGANYYKNRTFDNVWEKLFVSRNDVKDFGNCVHSGEAADLSHAWRSRYSELDLTSLKPIVSQYFSPSQQVLDRKKFLESKYQIDKQSCIAVHYRGTDKITEIANISLSDLVHEVELAMELRPNSRVLLQVDSLQVFEELKNRIGSRCFYIEELPHSDGLLGGHALKKSDRLLDAQTYLATVLIISECEYVITHTGNGGLWEYIYRGNADNFVQLSGE